MTLAILLIAASALASVMLADAPTSAKVKLGVPIVLLALIGLVGAGTIALPGGPEPNAAQIAFAISITLMGVALAAVSMLDLPTSGKVAMGIILVLTLPGWLIMSEAVTHQSVFT